jgi:trehalose 6-phosphate synthase/phosphatase
MVSGMKSLSETHEQIVVAWTGDVLLQTNPQPTPPPSFMAKFVPAQANEGSDLTPSAPTLASKSDEKPLMVFPGEFTDEEKQELNEELLKFGEIESQQDENGSKLSYVPVFLPNDVSKGHYEGFCKKSESQAKYCADQQHSGHCSTTSYGSTLPPLYPPPTHCGHITTRPTRSLLPRSQRCTGQET